MSVVAAKKKQPKPETSKLHGKGLLFNLTILFLCICQSSACNMDWPVLSVVLKLGKDSVDAFRAGIRKDASLSFQVKVGE